MFKNYDGSLISSQTVKYGKSAVPPENPAREGYTFTGWSGAYTNITGDTTITAQYKINTYTVKFVDSNDILINSQKVTYGSSAVAPETSLFTIPAGYVFAGWNSDSYLSVKNNETIKAICSWDNQDLPIITTITQAKRQEDGYYVYFDLANYPNAITRGRAVVSLKTSEGKLVDTTESTAFSIPASGAKTGMEVFVPCDKTASTAEVVIVNSYSSGVPISAVKSMAIDQNLEWSSWQETEPASGTYDEMQTRTVYKYRDKNFTTSTNSTVSGWTHYDTTSTSSSGTSESYVSPVSTDAHVRTVSTRTVTTPKYKTQYQYSHYYNSNTGNTSPVQYSGWSGPHYSSWMDSALPVVGQSGAGGNIYRQNGANYCSICGKNNWYNQTTRSVQNGSVNKTYYDYTDTYYTYYFYKWSDWSAWITDAITETTNRDVEETPQYRYRSSLAGVEDTDGEIRTVNGTLSTDYAGKQISLFVYKIDEASDYTNEFVGQQVIGEDGSYSFSFKLREEPSAKTGDFTVAIGIEGTTDIIIVDTFEAPKPTYTVNFYDYTGEIISTQTVTEGEAATVPENPVREGWNFVGWDGNITSIGDNTDFFARYVQNQYTIVFINWTTQQVVTSQFMHGDVITPPETPEIEGYTLLGWDAIINSGSALATQDMVLTAEYARDDCEVVFFDFDGNVISTQNIKYGDGVNIPDDLIKDNYVFLGWASSGGDFNSYYVKGDAVLAPVYQFDDTVAAPTASVATGTYNATQTVTLTCETEDAVIYYSTDGSNPLENGLEYSVPLTISKSTQLKFAACSFEMNDSEVVTELYAINTDNMTSDWMAYSDIPQYVLDDIATYSLDSNAGYRYKDIIETATLSEIESLLASGWTDEGTTPGITSEWSLERPVIEDLDYMVNEQEPDPVPATHYKYSHFKYYDDASQSFKYSNVPIDGISGVAGEITLASMLNVSGFIQGTTTPYFNYNGEQWFTQTPVTVYVPAGYMMYSYTPNVHTLSKWTGWSLQPPVEGETREIQSDTVYRYTVPEYRVVTIVSYPDQGMHSFFAVANEVLDIEPEDYTIEGHSFDGLYTDTEFTTSWNLDTDTVTQDIILYAKNAINTYSVTFKNSDGTVLDIQQVEYMSEAQEPVVPVDEGYVHVGWDTEDYLCVVEDLTVTARVVLEEDITKVTLSRGKYSMMEGSYYKLLATVTPEDLEDNSVVWTSSDYDIIDVDQNGNVYAVSAGTATVTAVAFDGTAAECVFTVIGNPDNFVTLKPTANYTIDDAGYIRGVIITTDEEADTHLAQTVAQVKAQFVNDNLVFTDINGNLLEDSDLIGTGTRAAIMNGDNPVDTVTFIVTGDTNGDGAINNRDAALATRYLVDKEAPNASQMIALDVNGDGYVNNRDASMLSRYLVGKEVI